MEREPQSRGAYCVSFRSLLTESSMYSRSLSIPIYALFSFLAAKPLVELPQNGSSMRSPSLVDASIILSSI